MGSGAEGSGEPVAHNTPLPVHSSLVRLQLGLGVDGGTGHRRTGSSCRGGDVDSLGLGGRWSSRRHLQSEERE